MSKQPPREGARWGHDPEPEPQPSPQEPEGYRELCEQYGEVNVQRAIALQRTLKVEFPNVALSKIDPIFFADQTLILCGALMRRSANDGLPHSLPETLAVLEKKFGRELALYPEATSFAQIPKLTLAYGDEDQGLLALSIRESARRKNKRIDNVFQGLGLVFGLTPIAAGIVVGFLKTPTDGIITVFVGSLIMWAVFKIFD